MDSRPHILPALCLAGVLFGADSRSDEADANSALKIYSERVQPLLKARCYACHGALKQEAGLRLDTGESIRRGSDTGRILHRRPEDSPLIHRIESSEEDRMPPDGKPLTKEQVTFVRDWIASGAPSPADEKPEASPSSHWAFQKPVRPVVPSETDWSNHPVDRLIQQQHRNNGLRKALPARPAHLLRRVAIDLTGLPPDTDTLRQFEADPSPKNYLSIVNKYLDSQQYAERWARHWMDVWRYSDWYGRRQQNDVRNSAPQIWRWRDWIIQSLNEDKGYHRMVQEMLAADEIAPNDDSTWPATGYLIRNYYSLNPNEWMRHNVEYTGKAFLGLTFNCAHCHDHKYDPIAHDDYFRMRAFFEPIGIRQDRVIGEREPPLFQPYTYAGSRKVVRTGMVRIYDQNPDAPTWFYTGGDERNRVEDHDRITPGVPEFLGVPFEPVAEQSLPSAGWYPGSRRKLQDWLLTEARRKLEAAESHSQAKADQAVATAVERELVAAQAELDLALKAAAEDGTLNPLAGRQSLHLQATQGRRILQHRLSGLSGVPEGTTIEFFVRINRSGNFNFQLARDAKKHLTALYLGFVDGTVKGYLPGTFREFPLGQYEQGVASPLIRVQLQLHPAEDIANVDIRQRQSAGDWATVAVKKNIALNGWNPGRNQDQPITLDCRDHTDVYVDEIRITAGTQKWYWGFESPQFADGAAAEGHEGWLLHPQSKGDASSLVEVPAVSPEAQQARAAVRSVRMKLKNARLPALVNELRTAAARTELNALQAVISADAMISDPVMSKQLSRAAGLRQHAAGLATARYELAAAQLQIKRLKNSESAGNDDEIARQQKRADAAAQKLAELTSSQAGAAHKPLSPIYPKTSTGRRRSLAKWITHSDNPLTPRVAVNHIWLRHFHRPLVESVYDFGRNGKEPTHPKLLNWLAVEFVEHGWSMKHLHRLLVTSRTYQLSSSTKDRDGSHQTDKDNRWLWRMNTGRMESEVVRDSILYIAGQLDNTVGGEVLKAETAGSSRRRSLYYEVYPEDGGHLPEATVFDPPDPVECFRRTTTVVPQQALALSNSSLVHDAATATVTIIDQLAQTDADWIEAAFRRVLSRSPSVAERKVATRFLGATASTEKKRALLRVLLNHNDFISIR